MNKVANVVGATGLVGEQLVSQLIEHPEFEKVRIFVRRKTGYVHPKLEEQVIDFNSPEKWTELVKGDVLFSTLGTTLKTAGTKEAQYKVDYTYQYEFAKAAADNGIPVYVLVSSLGANSKSAIFYSRIKGQLDEAVSLLPFRKVVILRPSVLDGERVEKRPGEKAGIVVMGLLSKFMMRGYRPTPIQLLASKMIDFALESQAGVRVVENTEII
jgi:uncharacterized protein YbjT (DUF2867 family)